MISASDMCTNNDLEVFMVLFSEKLNASFMHSDEISSRSLAWEPMKLGTLTCRQFVFGVTACRWSCGNMGGLIRHVTGLWHV